MIEARTRPIGLALVPDRLLWLPALVALGTLILTLSARLEIPLPFSPVPVTAQTLAVLLIGAAFGARLGAATVAVYVVEGLFGLPVYAGGTAGAARLGGPTGGYLVGFIVAAAFVGWAAERGWTKTVPMTVVAMIGGEVLIYLFGLGWLLRFPLKVSVLDAGLVPFIAGDMYKLALAAAVLPPVTRAITHARGPGKPRGRHEQNGTSLGA